MLLGTGTQDVSPLLEEAQNISLQELDECPAAWRGALLCTGRVRGVRVWALTDAPAPGYLDWTRAWPVWLARSAGAGACLVTAAGCGLQGSEEVDYLAVSDHLVMDGSNALTGLAASSLGPLFPDQGRVHHEGARAELVERAAKVGLRCSAGVLACTPGPTLETPAERRLYERAGAQATTQELGGVFHAMAHSGMGGLSLIALLGAEASSVEDLIERSERLAPGLLELIEAAVEPLAAMARREREEEL